MRLDELVLLLLTAGAVFYGVVLAPRMRYVIRAGWRGTVAHPGALVGLLCGMAGLVLVVMVLTTAWLALAHGAGIDWHAHQWVSMPLLICGFTFAWTDPGRQRGNVDHLIGARMRAHPYQALGGFILGAVTWAMFPLAPLLPASVRVLCLFAWIVLMLGVESFAVWWWWRHGSIEEVTVGQRTHYLPTYVTHPAFWGWIWGTALVLLLFTTLAQLRAGL